MDLRTVAVAADIKVIHRLTADHFQDCNGNYAPENAGIDWRAFITDYLEGLGEVQGVDVEYAESIRDEIFSLAMIAAAVKIEGAILKDCHHAQLTCDNFPVKYVNGVRRYGELTGNTLWLVNHLMSKDGLTVQEKKIILARYQEQVPEIGYTGFKLVACVLCLIEDTLLQSSVVLVPSQELLAC